VSCSRGLVDFGPQSAPAQSLLHAVAEQRVTTPATAWHCCLEFFSVATRLPPRVSGFLLAMPSRCLQAEVFTRIAVHDLPPGDRTPLLQAAAHDSGFAGGRIYDAHIAEVARAAGANVVVNGQPPAFPVGAAARAMRVETPSEFLAGLKKKPFVTDGRPVSRDLSVLWGANRDLRRARRPRELRAGLRGLLQPVAGWRVTGRGENRVIHVTR